MATTTGTQRQPLYPTDKHYRLNHEPQANGDLELHKEGCDFWPTKDFDDIFVSSDTMALSYAKIRNAARMDSINGCAHCLPDLHTT